MTSDEIMVSISCLVYNHEKYLRQCLDGFIMQKTDFKFEVLVHDDASTDHSPDIIREYEARYPDIIKPIYQTENQYSKGVPIGRIYQYPRAKGKYLAFCEGDDFWTDEYKLQKQCSYMENNPDCTICVHQAVKHDLYNNRDALYSTFSEERDVPIEEILSEGAIFATNSIVVRTQIHCSMPPLFHAKGFGDHQLIIYNTLNGKCHYLSDIMSVYNWGTAGSWTARVLFDKKKRADNCKEMILLMQRINEYTDHKYDDSIEKKIVKTELNYHVACGNFISVLMPKYNDYLRNNGINRTSVFKETVANRFPGLYRIVKTVKR